MHLTPFLLFDGNCAEAMTFYQTCLGGELNLVRLGYTPMGAEAPSEQQQKVPYAHLESGPAELAATDWLHPTRTPGRATRWPSTFSPTIAPSWRRPSTGWPREPTRTCSTISGRCRSALTATWPTATASTGYSGVSPVPEPLAAEGLERFAEVAAGHVGPDRIPGLVALVARRDQVHVEVLGSLAVSGRRVERDSLFRIASTSKPITGAAAAQRGTAADTFLAGRSWSLCQSVITEGERAGAFGWEGGLGSSWLVDPARHLVVIVLTQKLWDSPQLPAVHTELRDAAYAALS